MRNFIVMAYYMGTVKLDSLDTASLNDEALQWEQVYNIQSVPFFMSLSTEIAR